MWSKDAYPPFYPEYTASLFYAADCSVTRIERWKRPYNKLVLPGFNDGACIFTS
jgi:hypothetical protein